MSQPSPSVRLVSFNEGCACISRATASSPIRESGHGAAGAMPYPYQVVNHSEDIVVPQPVTVDGYPARFGKATRQTFKQPVARAEGDLPECSIEIVRGADIVEEDSRAVLRGRYAYQTMLQDEYHEQHEQHGLSRIVVYRSEAHLCAMRPSPRVMLLGPLLTAPTIGCSFRRCTTSLLCAPLSML